MKFMVMRVFTRIHSFQFYIATPGNSLISPGCLLAHNANYAPQTILLEVYKKSAFSLHPRTKQKKITAKILIKTFLVRMNFQQIK